MGGGKGNTGGRGRGVGVWVGGGVWGWWWGGVFLVVGCVLFWLVLVGCGVVVWGVWWVGGVLGLVGFFLGWGGFVGVLVVWLVFGGGGGGGGGGGWCGGGAVRGGSPVRSDHNITAAKGVGGVGCGWWVVGIGGVLGGVVVMGSRETSVVVKRKIGNMTIHHRRTKTRKVHMCQALKQQASQEGNSEERRRPRRKTQQSQTAPQGPDDPTS